MSNRLISVAKRDSNIELLRALTMIGVIILHINNPLIGGALNYSKSSPGLYWILLGYESLFACAVNLFLVVTGYFMVNRKTISLKKPIQLIIQVIVFSTAFYILGAIKAHTFSTKALFGSLLPRNYFVIIYCAIYLVSPYINQVLCSLEIHNLKRFMVLSVVVFSVIPTVLDTINEFTSIHVDGLYPTGMFGSGYGYTFVNFALMYTWGGYIRRMDKISIKTNKLVAVLFINVVLLSIWSHFSINEGDFVESSSLSYCNPLIIINAVIVFILFSRLKIKPNRLGQTINVLAKPCFTVYLVHNHILHWLNFDELIQSSGVFFAAVVIAMAIGIYMMCILIGYIYSYTCERLVIFWLDRLPALERLKISVD